MKKKDKKVHLANDFEYINMPHNRRELFFDVLKQRWRTIYLLGFIFFLTLIPSLLILYFQDAATLTILSDPSLSEIELNMELARNSLIFSAIISVSLLFVSIFIGGILRNLRTLAYEEPVFFKDDFFHGIKNSISQTFLAFLIYSLIVFITLVSISFPNISALAQGVIISVLVLFVTPLFLIVLCQTYIYQNTFRNLIFNAFLLYIKFFHYMLLLGVIYFIPLIFILFVGNPIIKYSLIIGYLLLIFPLVMLFTVILMNYLFDKGINEKHYPELANKGLYIEKDNKD